jgi:hypothetical protein
MMKERSPGINQQHVAGLCKTWKSSKTMAPGKDSNTPMPILKAKENPKQSIKVTIYFNLFDWKKLS